MGDGKALPLVGGILFFFALPLIIVAVLLMGTMIAQGEENPCAAPPATGKAFGWPTDEHEADPGYSDDHKGLDFDVDEDTPVRAAADGEVVSIDGDWIKIRHQEGVETWYKFFKSKSVTVGKKVKRGDEIGRSGSGDEDDPGADGEHLHFEMQAKDEDGDLKAVDPTDSVGDAAAPPSECDCGGGPLVGSDNQEKAFNYLASNGYTKEQAAGAVGNMIHESSVEPARQQNTDPGTVTSTAAARGSGLGWGIVQWTPPSKMIDPSRQAGVKDETIQTLEHQLEFLKKQLDGTGPTSEKAAGDAIKRARTVEEAAFEFADKFERFGGHEDPNNPEFDERRATAREVFKKYGGGGTGGKPGEPVADTGCGAGNGDVVKTAHLLAWDWRGAGPNKEDAKPSYQAAMPKYNGADHTFPYSDCGVYVATVMVMSGVDKDYHRRLTGEQRQYVKNSPKYQTWDNLTDEGQLRPGDIFVNNGHTFLYVGPFKDSKSGQKWNSLSASLYGRVPQPAMVTFQDGNGVYTVARIKK